jgi:telomerase protein component 1
MIAVEMLWEAILTECDGEDLEGDTPSEHDLFAHEQSEVFVGRNSLLEKLTSHVDDTPEGGSSFIVVTGRAGVGKTALLSAFAEHERLRHGSHALLVHFVGPIPDSNDIRKSLHRMCQALVSRLGPGYDIPQTFDELREFFPVALETAVRRSPTSRLLVIIDGINQFSEANGGQALGWLPAALPPGVVFVVTTREGPQEQLLKARKSTTHVTVPALSPSDRQALVRTTLARYRKRLDESSFNNQLSLLTNKRDAALPLFLIVACEELRVGATFESLSDILRQLAAHVSGLFEQVLARLESAHGIGLMSTVFKLFACARAGLRERDLLALIARAHPQRAAPAILARVFRSLEPFLVCSGSSRAFMLFHDEFAKAVTARYLSDTRDLATSHAFLVVQYKALSDPRGDGSFVGRDALALSELPYHLTLAGMHVDLARTLTSLGFIQASAAAGVCHALIDAYTLPAHLKTTHVQDIQRALTSPAVCEFADFVNRNSHIFSLRPGLVFQQALNSPSASAPARIAASMLSPHVSAPIGTALAHTSSESLSRTSNIQRSVSGSASTSAGVGAVGPAAARSVAGARTAKQQAITRLAAADMPLMIHENKSEESEPCVRTIAGLLQPVTALAVSPDSRLVAVGLRSGALSLYDTSNMRELWVVSAHASTITDLAFVDATRLCSASADCSLALRLVTDGSTVFVNRDAGRRVSGLALSHDTESVAFASWDATLRVMSLKDGKTAYSTKPGKRALGCIAHHPTTPVVAAGDWSGAFVYIWVCLCAYICVRACVRAFVGLCLCMRCGKSVAVNATISNRGCSMPLTP